MWRFFTLIFITMIMITFATPSNGEESVGLVGGTSNEKYPDVNDPVYAIVASLTKDIKTQVSLKMPTLSTASTKDVPISIYSYKTQVVAGTNYFVKATVGEQFFHLRIYKDLQGNASLVSTKGPVKESDPIEYFN